VREAPLREEPRETTDELVDELLPDDRLTAEFEDEPDEPEPDELEADELLLDPPLRVELAPSPAADTSAATNSTARARAASGFERAVYRWFMANTSCSPSLSRH
jgi:hypothetical protein